MKNNRSLINLCEAMEVLNNNEELIREQKRRIDKASKKSFLENYYGNSVSQSVCKDYKEGNIEIHYA